MGKSKEPSFITELALVVSPSEESICLTRLDAARQVFNACLGESLRRLALLRQSKAYRTACRMPKGKKNRKQAQARVQAFRDARRAVGFSEYDLHAYAAQFNHCWLGQHLDINTIQKLATRAFNAVEQYAYGKRGRPRFKGKNQLDSVEGKTNASGIRWRDNCLVWMGLKLQAIIPEDDAVIAHGLSCPVKYVRLVRRKIGGRNRFYVQLVNKGKPYQKEKNQPGKGVVGLDIGPSTLAVVGEQDAFLEMFCAELMTDWKTIRRMQRQIDRQRRANNSDNYNSDGTVKKGVKS